MRAGAVGSADISKLADALRTSGHRSPVTTREVLIQASSFILSDMQARVPVRSGNLRSALGIKVHADAVEIGPDAAKAPYAGYVEYGTKPHVIKPKAQGKSLSFVLNGKRVYAREVHHPGTKAQPYVRPAFQDWIDDLGKMAAEANIKVIKDHAP